LPIWQAEGEENVLFVNKKNQKNFVTCVMEACAPAIRWHRGFAGAVSPLPQVTKFFCFFCSQKEDFPCRLRLSTLAVTFFRQFSVPIRHLGGMFGRVAALLRNLYRGADRP
jgi:hypothetical protein